MNHQATAPQPAAPIPVTGRTWLVCDTDEGVLRRENSLSAAKTWAMTYQDCGAVRSRYRYAPGSYDYTFTDDAGDAYSVYIGRAEAARAQGFDPAQPPRFPYPGDRQFDEDTAARPDPA